MFGTALKVGRFRVPADELADDDAADERADVVVCADGGDEARVIR